MTLNEADPSNPADSEFYWMKGLYITPAGANGNGSQIVQATAGDAISLQARVYNYSLAVMPPGSTVHVRFYGQEWDKDKADFTGAAFVIDEVRLDPIPPFNPSSGEPNWVLASTTLDTTSYADQYLIFWVVVWMEQNGELVPEPTGHGLTAIPGATTAPTAVAIERYSNNVGFYKQPFFVCPNPCQRLSAPASAATAESLAVEKVEVAPNRVSIFENVTVTATLAAEESSLDGVLVVYYDGDPQQGGEAFDAELIPHIRANDAYVNRVKFRPRTCGPHTVFVVAQSTATGTATVTVDCPPCARRIRGKSRAGGWWRRERQSQLQRQGARRRDAGSSCCHRDRDRFAPGNRRRRTGPGRWRSTVSAGDSQGSPGQQGYRGDLRDPCRGATQRGDRGQAARSEER